MRVLVEVPHLYMFHLCQRYKTHITVLTVLRTLTR